MPDSPAHLSDPRDLKVQRGTEQLEFTVTDWRAVGRKTLLGFGALYALALLGSLLLGDGAFYGSLALIAMLGVLPPLVALPILGRFHRVHMSFDAFGATLNRRTGPERLYWSEFDEVVRKGRKLTLLAEGRSVVIPSPSAYVDAQWMERIIQEGIDSAEDRAGEVPEELSRLRAAAGAQAERGG